MQFRALEERFEFLKDAQLNTDELVIVLRDMAQVGHKVGRFRLMFRPPTNKIVTEEYYREDKHGRMQKCYEDVLHTTHEDSNSYVYTLIGPFVEADEARLGYTFKVSEDGDVSIRNSVKPVLNLWDASFTDLLKLVRETDLGVND